MKNSRVIWYLEHRIEYLSNKQSALKKVLEQTDSTFDYDLLKEFMEIKGRLKELQHLIERIREF